MLFNDTVSSLRVVMRCKPYTLSDRYHAALCKLMSKYETARRFIPKDNVGLPFSQAFVTWPYHQKESPVHFRTPCVFQIHLQLGLISRFLDYGFIVLTRPTRATSVIFVKYSLNMCLVRHSKPSVIFCSYYFVKLPKVTQF